MSELIDDATKTELIDILSHLEDPVTLLVFVDADPEFVSEAVVRCRLSAVQYSGSETPEVCSASPVPAVKVIAVGEDFGWNEAERYRGAVSALLLDTYVAGVAGGTSQTFSWGSIDHVPGWVPVMVAGGLTPDNVGACIRTLRPFAVDVSSGVEASPGIKDRDRLVAFFHAVDEADQEVGTR